MIKPKFCKQSDVIQNLGDVTVSLSNSIWRFSLRKYSDNSLPDTHRYPMTDHLICTCPALAYKYKVRQQFEMAYTWHSFIFRHYAKACIHKHKESNLSKVTLRTSKIIGTVKDNIYLQDSTLPLHRIGWKCNAQMLKLNVDTTEIADHTLYICTIYTFFRTTNVNKYKHYCKAF